MRATPVHHAIRQAQLDAIQQRLEYATFKALSAWTSGVGARLLGSRKSMASLLAAAGDGDSAGQLNPDPEIAARMVTLWAALVAAHLLPVVRTQLAQVMERELEADAEQLAEARTAVSDLLLGERGFAERFVADLPNRLADVPMDTFELLRADLLRGIREGLSHTEIRNLMAQSLSVGSGGSPSFWSDRAALIARTETTRVLNAGMQAAWSARNAVLGETTYKQWMAALDGRTREAHAEADGQVVPLDADFYVGGESMAYPGDPRGSSANTANCRCVLAESADGSPVSSGGMTAAATDSADDPSAVLQPGVVRDRNAVLVAAGGNMTMAGKAQTWSGLLAPIGVNSGDRRRLAANGTFTHRDLPLPVMMQNATAGGHDNSVVVGRILTVTIGDGPEGLGIYGAGDYLLGDQFAPDVARAVELTTNGLGHVSVDLADVTAELVDADGNPVPMEKLMAAFEAGEELDVYDQFSAATLIGVTMVAKPAFAQAIICLDGAAPVERTPDMAALERAAAAEEALEADTAEAADAGEDPGDEADDSDVTLTDSDGSPIEVGDRVRIVVADTDDDTESDDDSDATKAMAAEGTQELAPFDPDNDGDDDSTDDGDTDSDSVEGTVTAIDVSGDQVTVQPDDESAQPVTGKSADVKVLAKGDAGTDTPQPGDGGGWAPGAANEATDSAEEQVASLAAAAGVLIEFRPDAEFFANPQLSALTPMTVGPADEHGYRRVFGHVAGWKTCHIAYSTQCVTPPREDDFSYFHVGEVTLADGSDLAVGNLTLGGRHADPRAAYRDAVEHYDDSGAGVAVVRAYADEFGIAIAGVITPEASELQVGQLRRSGLSGDWRRIGGSLRLCGALAVNTGGFPVPRYATDGGGRILSLVAAGSVPQALKVEESYEEVARRVFHEERQKMARREEVAALVASATSHAEAVNRESLTELLAGLDLDGVA